MAQHSPDQPPLFLHALGPPCPVVVRYRTGCRRSFEP
jgi:hypothetical protein